MLRVIQEIRPTWVVAENVGGFVHVALDRTLSDLEVADYETETLVLPACAVGTPHRRDRVFIVAYSSVGGFSRFSGGRSGSKPKNGRKDLADASGLCGASIERCEPDGVLSADLADGPITGLEGGREGLPDHGNGRPAQPGVGRVLDGVSARLDGHRWPTGPGQQQYEWEPPRVARGVKDRVNRLKALGNAVVPAQVYPILAVVAEIERVFHRKEHK